ncbi:MAG: rRNA maturation RNase YbeY [Gammaproteobacteria bacterium]|nr:MAG: rRNA maturation RNase YbeY [Gammaproteobacteria bacterium]
MSCYLEIQNSTESNSIPKEQDVLLWIEKALELSNSKVINLELTIRIVSLDESQQLNSDYRGKNKPTNVLSFPFEIPEGLPVDVLESENMESILGDLAICEAIVIEEAKEQSKQVNHHWAHMVVHGVLHLVGYDHVDDSDAKEMESLEVEILSQLGIGSPY